MPHHGQLVHSPTTNINITIINRKMPPINLVFMSYQFKILSNHLTITLCALILLLTAIICIAQLRNWESKLFNFRGIHKREEIHPNLQKVSILMWLMRAKVDPSLPCWTRGQILICSKTRHSAYRLRINVGST